MPQDSFGHWMNPTADGQFTYSYYNGNKYETSTVPTFEEFVPGTSWPTWENRQIASDKELRSKLMKYDEQFILESFEFEEAYQQRWNYTNTAKMFPPTCLAYMTNTSWGHNKFYKMLVHNGDVYCQYGKIGRRGTVTHKTHLAPNARNRALIANLRKRLLGGYSFASPPLTVLEEYQRITRISLPEEMMEELKQIGNRKPRLRKLIRK